MTMTKEQTERLIKALEQIALGVAQLDERFSKITVVVNRTWVRDLAKALEIMAKQQP